MEELLAAVPPSGGSKEGPRLGFIFTGQGAQWARMGMELHQYDIFQSSLESAEAVFREQLKCLWSVIEEMEREEGSAALTHQN